MARPPSLVRGAFRGALSFATGAAVVGGAALLCSTVVMGTAKAIVRKRKLQSGVTCLPCEGVGWVQCEACGGRYTIQWSPFDMGPLEKRRVLCPGCKGRGQHKCFTCLGDGIVTPLNKRAR